VNHSHPDVYIVYISSVAHKVNGVNMITSSFWLPFWAAVLGCGSGPTVSA